MRMPVMNIGIVRVLVRECLVPVQMDVRFFALPGELALMLMMLIVAVRMGMHERLV